MGSTETVMKPRILKVIYSKDWKDGKASRTGIHAFKYLKSPTRTRNNIAFTHEADGQEALALWRRRLPAPVHTR